MRACARETFSPSLSISISAADVCARVLYSFCVEHRFRGCVFGFQNGVCGFKMHMEKKNKRRTKRKSKKMWKETLSGKVQPNPSVHRVVACLLARMHIMQ